MHCPYCNKELSDGAAFCSGCGQKISPTSSTAGVAPTCWKCHTPLKGNASFCSQCGSKQTPLQSAAPDSVGASAASPAPAPASSIHASQSTPSAVTPIVVPTRVDDLFATAAPPAELNLPSNAAPAAANLDPTPSTLTQSSTSAASDSDVLSAANTATPIAMDTSVSAPPAQTEQTLPEPTATSSQAPALQPVPPVNIAPNPQPTSHGDLGSTTAQPSSPPPSNMKRYLVVGAIVLLLAAVGGAYYLMSGSTGNSAPTMEAPPPTSMQPEPELTTAPAPLPETVPAQPEIDVATTASEAEIEAEAKAAAEAQAQAQAQEKAKKEAIEKAKRKAEEAKREADAKARREREEAQRSTPPPAPAPQQPVTKARSCSEASFLSRPVCVLEGPTTFWKCAPDGSTWNNNIPGCMRSSNNNDAFSSGS